MWMPYVFNKNTFAIARFGAFYPGVFWAMCAVPLLKDLRKHSLPGDIPHRHEIYISQWISGILSVVLTLWMIPSTIYILAGSIKGKGNWLAFYCIIDWGIVALVITSLAFQSHYLPGTFSGCHQAQTWQVVGNGRNLFSFMADSTCSKSDEPCSCHKKCHEYVQAGVLSIVVLIFALFSAIYPLLNVPIPWPLVWLYGHIRASFKLSLQVLRQLWKSIMVKLGIHSNPDKRFEMQQWRKKRNATIFDILNEDRGGKTMISLAQNLHYVDIVSLSLTSSAMHRATFPKLRSLKVAESIKISACAAPKSECWCCAVEICQTCEQRTLLLVPATQTHVDHCQPYCSKCYYRDLCERYISGTSRIKIPSSYGGWQRNCPCRTTPTESALGTKYQRSLCKFCASLDHGAAVRVREAREEAELRHLAKQQLRCVHCDRGLGREGLRWWGCSLCKKECTSGFHPMWDRKK